MSYKGLTVRFLQNRQTLLANDSDCTMHNVSIAVFYVCRLVCNNDFHMAR